jgi:hypothetical protein
VFDGECRVRGVYLDGIPGIERAEVKGGVPRRHLELEVIRFLVLQADLSVRPSAHKRAGGNLDLQIPWGAGRELVARGEGCIDLGLHPILGTRTPKRCLPVNEAQPWRSSTDRGLLGSRGLVPPNGMCSAYHQAERHYETEDLPSRHFWTLLCLPLPSFV